MKAIKIITSVIAVLALVYYAYRFFGKPNGEIYEVDKNHHVYYNGEGVTKEDAKKTGEFFTQIGYFKTDNEVDVQISANKDMSDLKIAYIVDKDKITPELENGFVTVSSSLSESVFNNKKMAVSIADEQMDEIKNLGNTQQAQIEQQTDKNNINKTDEEK